jgi:hypothetical protein
MLINDLIEIAEKIPPMLAGGWAAWLFVGLLLSMWGRRERSRLVVHSTKPKSNVKPPTKRPNKGAPAGDAFGELEAMLEPPTGTHRLPGESPVERSTTVLATPQSLP